MPDALALPAAPSASATPSVHHPLPHPHPHPQSSSTPAVVVDGLEAKMALASPDLVVDLEPTAVHPDQPPNEELPAQVVSVTTHTFQSLPRPRAKTQSNPQSDIAAVKPFCDRIKRARQQQQRQLLRQRERRAKSASQADLPNMRKLQRMEQVVGMPSLQRGTKRLRICNLVVHAVVPQVGSSAKHRHTEYALIVEHVLSGRVWEVSRRYSAFVELRRELAKALEGDAPKRRSVHCSSCQALLSQVKALEAQFPAKRFFDSRRSKVVLARAAAFCAYLQQLVALAARAHQSSCRNVSARYCGVLYAFLTVEREDFCAIPATASELVVPSLLREIAGGASGVRLSRIEEAEDVEDLEETNAMETAGDLQHAGSALNSDDETSSGSDELAAPELGGETKVDATEIESIPDEVTETEATETEATAA